MFKLLTFIPALIVKSFVHLAKILFKNTALALGLVLIILAVGGYLSYRSNNDLKLQLVESQNLSQSNREKLASISAQLAELENEDQVKKNLALQAEIAKIHSTYQQAVKSFEALVDLKTSPNFGKAAIKDIADLDKSLAEALNKLSNRDYTGASTTLDSLNKNIQTQVIKIAPTPAPVAVIPLLKVDTPANNTPPASGYSRQNVNSDAGMFVVDIVSADLNSTKVVIDTAADDDCHDNCPVLSLADYASRSGAYAGVNGSYFCPAAYPSCAGKTNSYDTLIMNKNKKYFNSDNNVYSTVPAAIFSAGSARFVGQSLEWGRDTGVDGVIANQPLLLSGGNVVFGGGSDPKQGSKGARSFVGAGSGKVYIGVVQNATVAEVARVLKAMGMSEALNLDSGGSTALWAGGYKVGPGRQIPNAVLFVNR